MTARLKVHIERGATSGVVVQPQQSVSFSMVLAILLMESFAYDVAVFNYNTTHKGIRPYTPQSIGGKLKAATHIDFVRIRRRVV